MSPTAFKRFTQTILGTSALAATMLVAACGYSSTTGSTGTTANTLTACHVTTADLTLPGAGTATATKATLSGSTTLSIDGSTALAPLFQDAQKSFDNVNGTTTTINPNGSGTGLKDVASGAVQIGMSDVFAKEKEPTPGAYANLVDHQVAVVAFTLVVSHDIASTVQNLTTQQIKAIYAGTTTNWSQVGGPNEPITVVVRTKTSGTRATFRRYTLGDPNATNDEPTGAQTADKTGELVTDIANGKGAIGYASTSFVLNSDQASTIYPVCIDGYGASAANINSGKYTFWSYEHAYTKGEAATGSATKAFLDFTQSADFQSKDLPKLGFLTVGSLSDAAKTTHPAP